MYTQGFGQSGDDGTGGGGDIVDYPFYGPLTPAEQALQTVTGTPLTASQVAAAASGGADLASQVSGWNKAAMASMFSGGVCVDPKTGNTTSCYVMWLNQNATTVALVGGVVVVFAAVLLLKKK